MDKYCSELKDAKRNSIIMGTLTYSFMGLMFGLIYGAYGIGFWYGNKIIMDYRSVAQGSAMTPSPAPGTSKNIKIAYRAVSIRMIPTVWLEQQLVTTQ